MKQLKQSNRVSSAPVRLLSKLLLLTLLKEGYLLLANFYGFLVHPYLTLKKISQDRSQMAIFASLWVGGWLGVLLILVLTFLISYFLPQFNLLKWIFLVIGAISGIFLLLFSFYLFYWLVIFWKKK